MPHYPPSGHMWGHLTAIEPKQCPGGGDIEFSNNCHNRGVWLTGLALLQYACILWLVVERRAHPCEARFSYLYSVQRKALLSALLVHNMKMSTRQGFDNI